MDNIEVIEVIAEINGEGNQGDPQNEIRLENGEILGDEQIKNTKKGKSKEQEKSEGRVCYFWLKEKCKFRNNCRNAHPELCKTIMEKGKCLGNCDKYHPKICNAMKQNGFYNRGQMCYHTQFGDMKPREMNSQRNLCQSNQIPNTY